MDSQGWSASRSDYVSIEAWSPYTARKRTTTRIWTRAPAP